MRRRGGETYSWFEGNELEDHLHSENPGEDHVEDVHGIIKQMRLAVMLKITWVRHIDQTLTKGAPAVF